MNRSKSWIPGRVGLSVLALSLASAQRVAGDAPEAGDVARTDVRITSADDLSLFVRDYGKGETPIVLLTGGPGYSGDYLEGVALQLGKEHRVLLADQRGTGRSVINPWDESRITVEASVADVEALRVHSGAERVIVVGHSWGGVLALAYAAEHGEQVRAMVLIGSGGANARWNMRYSRNILARLTQEDLAAVIQAQGLLAKDPEAGMIASIRATAPAMMMNRELALRYADEYAGPATLTPAVTLAMQGWLQQYDLGDGLNAVDAPVLFVQGEHDPIGKETAEETAKLFEHSEVQWIGDAAHEPYIEQPEAFFAIVDPFLREHAGAPKEQ